jgi:hypothetical protein
VPLASDVLGLLRFAAGLKPFLREPLSAAHAKAIVQDQMQRRGERLLAKLDRAVFANPLSPYLRLMRAAGCEPGDVRGLVERDGVEATLQALLRAGVYVTFEEFKGRTPIVRGSDTFTVSAADFDNPVLTPHFTATSSGTRGRPTRILIDIDHIAQSAPHWRLWFAAHDLGSRPLLFWTPAHSGVANRHLLAAKCGKPYARWFVDVEMVSVKDRLVAPTVHWLVRRATGSPAPELVPIADAAKVGRVLADMARQGLKPCIVTSPSEAVRACLAMQAERISLDGVTFLLGAEPLTQARKDTIEAGGAAAVPTYGFAEGGNVGSQCDRRATAADDVHVSLDAYAVIQRDGAADASTPSDALLLTALRPACPKVLLNTEIGDSAIIETRRCGCLFDDVGYVQHLHTIRSFEKITGFGVTFVAADLYRVIEEALPRRVGGAVTDYQLVEAQDARGIPRYTLYVSPDVGPVADSTVIATFLEELGKLTNHYRYMVNLWDQPDMIRVQRARPLVTSRGKVLPFRTLGPA